MLDIGKFGIHKEEGVLSNGSRIILFKRNSTPISISTVFFSGSCFDPPSKEGLSHFLEHMLVSGTKNLPTKDKLASYIEQFGGQFSAFTGAETLNLNVTMGDPKDLKEAVWILGEMLSSSLFNKKTIETERNSILKELGDRKSNPREMLNQVYRRLFFQETDIGKPTLGTEESIKNIQKEDIINFYEKMVTSERMVLVASGDINLNDFKKLAEQNLLLPKSEKFCINDNLIVKRVKDVDIEHYSDIDHVHLMFGFRTVSIFHSDVPALEIIAEVLGGGRASTLIKRLRYEKGLVYNVNSAQITSSDCGAWIIRTSTSKEKLQELLDVITNEIMRIKSEGLTSEELTFAKNKIIKSKRMQMQTSESWVNFHSYSEVVGKKGWDLSVYIKEISSVTPELVKQVIRKYFIKDNWYLAMCGNITNKDFKINF